MWCSGAHGTLAMNRTDLIDELQAELQATGENRGSGAAHRSHLARRRELRGLLDDLRQGVPSPRLLAFIAERRATGRRETPG